MKRIAEGDLRHILLNTSGFWDKVRNKSIFITGATGFFGRWLLESFLFINNKLSLNAHVCGLSRNPRFFLEEYPFFKDSSINFIKGDIQTFEFPSDDYHFVIHAATDADAQKNVENPLLMLETITMGTRRALEFAQKKSIESFLFTSSGAVYGKQPSTVTHIKENEGYAVDINNPQSAYAEGKRLAELYCSIYFSHYQVPVKIARCFAFVGPYLPLNKHYAIGNFILNALKGEDIIIKGDGTPYRSYLYAADLTIWLWTILLKGENNTPYNVGSDEDYDLKTIANLFTDINPSITVNILSKSDLNKPVERYVPDITSIQQRLGLKVELNLLEGIKRTLDFYKTF
ncbi:MAG TPA: NAD-dependent epimerase/dehydratase family protein [Segetibacter sp.]